MTTLQLPGFFTVYCQFVLCYKAASRLKYKLKLIRSDCFKDAICESWNSSETEVICFVTWEANASHIFDVWRYKVSSGTMNAQKSRVFKLLSWDVLKEFVRLITVNTCTIASFLSPFCAVYHAFETRPA